MKQLLTILMLMTGLVTVAQDGTLDLTFGINGKAFNQSVDGSSRTVTFVQPNGKIIQNSNSYIEGQTFAAVRYNSDGSIDNTFGNNGMVTTAVSPFQDNSNTITAQPDGKVIVGGQSLYIGEDGMSLSGRLVLLRYNSNGTPDNSFDVDGIVEFAVPGYMAGAYSIVVLPDGKLLVAGYITNESETIKHSLLVRFNTNGSVDNTFGINGQIVSMVGTGNDDIYNLALQADGKIVIAGSAIISGHAQFVALRFSSNGTPDNSFGTNGQVVVDVAPYKARITSIAVQPDNKVIIAGNSQYISGDQEKFTIVRLKADGTLDETFNSTGLLYVTSSNRGGFLYSILIQQDNKILLGGILTGYNIITQKTSSDFVIFRFTGAGVLDQTLINDYALGQAGTTGASGEIFLNGGTDDYWGNIAFQGTKIIVGGTASYQPAGNPFETPRLMVARINNGIGAVLPLTLLSFNVVAVNHTALLTWQTSGEHNTSNFEIEKSSNGVNFQRTGTVNAAGSADHGLNYSFTDPDPANGFNYYRLKMIDRDGKFSYSALRVVYFDNTFGSAVKYYPVPTTGLLNIELGKPLTNEERNIRVFNTSGATVKEVKVTGNQSLLQLDLAAFPKGAYIIQVKTASESSTQRVVLQ